MDIDYWRKVFIVTLVILLVIIAYRKLLRLVGGKERFNNKFAYLAPLKKDENGNLVVNFELTEESEVSIILAYTDPVREEIALENSLFQPGQHEVILSNVNFAGGEVLLVLQTHNQKIERKLQ